MTIVTDNPMLEQEVPLSQVHADPVQPRVHPDAELAESIKTQGILQAITIEPLGVDSIPDTICEDCGCSFVDLASEGGHFLIVDGERRYRGAIVAGQTTVLAKIIPPTTEADRLLRQLTSNTGKPLTPIEEAFAFKRIMEVEGWSQVELAKQLGRPRSVIGDRIRLVELDPAWLDLIGSGKLQTSHAAILSVFTDVPAAYQKKASLALMADYRVKRFVDVGDAIPVEEFKSLIYVAFRDYIKPLKDVPGYKGPVFTFKRSSYGSPEKFAADIAIWRPIFRARENKRRKESESTRGSRKGQVAQRDRHKEAVDALGAEGVPSREVPFYFSADKKGEVILYGPSGWNEYAPIDPAVVMANVLPTKLCRIYSKSSGGGAYLITNDAAAIEAGRIAYVEKLNAVFAEKTKDLRSKTAAALTSGKYTVTGAGCRLLVGTSRDHFVIHAVAGVAMKFTGEHSSNLSLDLSHVTEADAARILSVQAALVGEKLKAPHAWSIIEEAGKQLRSHAELKLPKGQKRIDPEKAAKKAAGQQRGKEIAIARKNGAAAPAADVAVEELEEATA